MFTIDMLAEEAMNKRIKLIIIEDDVLFRTILKKMLINCPNIEVCADFDNAEEALVYIKNNRVDVVLMDTCLTFMSGVEASKIINAYNPDIKVILFTSNNQDSELLALLSAKVNALLQKDISQYELSNIINSVMQGRCWVDFRIQQQVFCLVKYLPEEDYLYFMHLLSYTESKLINLVLKGFKNREIGKYLNIGFAEIPNYVFSIFNKLSKTKKAEVAIQEIRYDLF